MAVEAVDASTAPAVLETAMPMKVLVHFYGWRINIHTSSSAGFSIHGIIASAAVADEFDRRGEDCDYILVEAPCNLGSAMSHPFENTSTRCPGEPTSVESYVLEMATTPSNAPF